MSRCIICDKELKEIVCYGEIGDMKVAFCVDHSGLCEGCECVSCVEAY